MIVTLDSGDQNEDLLSLTFEGSPGDPRPL